MTQSEPLDALLIALHQGIHEEQLWSTFLMLLKDHTNSDYASLIFLQGDVPMHEATELFVGRDVRSEGRRQGHGDLFRTDPIRYRALQLGKVHKINELMNLDDPDQAAFRQAYLDRGGVRYSRYMRVGNPQGVSAWAIVLRESHDFGAVEDGLLAGLATHLTIAVQNFAALEQARFHSIMGDRALRRAGICWAAFDREGQFISADTHAEATLATVTGHAPAAGRRLMTIDKVTDSAIIDACADFAEHPHAQPRVTTIGPPFDISLLLLPFRSRPLTGVVLPAMMALWRMKSPNRGPVQAAALTDMFGFTKSEAKFAAALLQGHTVNEAAKALDLTVLTARQYSKALFAKAKAKGQPDLIRILLDRLPI